jgi:hypothetical protein
MHIFDAALDALLATWSQLGTAVRVTRNRVFVLLMRLLGKRA